MKLDLIINQPVVETELFDLRPLRKSDEGLIEHYGSDERVARMTTSIAHPLPPGATEAFVARAMTDDRDEDVWAMDGTKTGGAEVMGLISLQKLDRNQSEISYWVAPVYWNTGLATRAVRALVDANPLKNDTMFGSVFQDNPASARVLIRCGFEYLGDAESYSVARDATVPTWTYSRKL
ncbi:GNAT family N-acetyltransferase [Pukyongiella litopenaei]|uniref:GNAT family N-acetyltransferase n=1 Tax=Pukyongiella litopenaei TaxID=2605946 RepID=A0A2S0MUT8_9RHOB|nr:GNAT family N-acetyltransferase [Pukyongiella litopenaei]AVO39491.1 GNAT family N-acetyltransferase [Pukyongiella litopenaei]